MFGIKFVCVSVGATPYAQQYLSNTEQVLYKIFDFLTMVTMVSQMQELQYQTNKNSHIKHGMGIEEIYTIWSHFVSRVCLCLLYASLISFIFS